MPFVLDNSVAMRWALKDREPEVMQYAAKVLERLAGGDQAMVPSLWGLEAANVIARAQKKGLMNEATAAQCMAWMRDLNIEADHETHTHALNDTYRLALIHNLSAYDASYLELALRKGLPLATLDDDLLAALNNAGGQRLLCD